MAWLAWPGSLEILRDAVASVEDDDEAPKDEGEEGSDDAAACDNRSDGSGAFAWDEGETYEEEQHRQQLAEEDESGVGSLPRDVVEYEEDEDEVIEYEEDEENEDEVEAPRRLRITERKQTRRDWHVIVGGYMVDKATKDALIAQHTAAFIGGSAHFKPGPWKPKQEGTFAKAVGSVDKFRRRVLTCPFQKEACCTLLLRESEHEDGLWVVEECGGPHANHSLIVAKPRRGLPKAIKAAVLSPSKLKLKSLDALEVARDEIGVITEKEQGQIVRARSKLKRKHEVALVPADKRGKFAAVHHFCAMYRKEAIEDFGIHSVYVVGTPKISSESQSIAITLSSENLMLNAYRQTRVGMPCMLQVDTTHRLVIEGHNCMLFGVVDPAQHFHVVGYGVCSEEDTAAHKSVISNLKEEVESIVNARIASQTPI